MPVKLAVGIPAYRGIVASHQAQMWMEFGAALVRSSEAIKLMTIANVDVCGVDRARNLLLATAMKEGADWLLMVDSDTWVHPGSDLVRMVIEAPENCALVGASVRLRGLGRGEAAPLNYFDWNENENRHEPIPVKSMPDNKTHLEVDAIGGAVIAINLHRLVITDQFRWFYYDDGRSISEDLYFCRQLRKRDEKIYVDMRMKTFHVDKSAVLGNG